MSWFTRMFGPPLAGKQYNPPLTDFPAAPPSIRSVFRPAPGPGPAQQMAFQAWNYLLDYNPLGAGAVPSNPIKVTSNPGFYANGAVIWGLQQINFGRQPPATGGALWTPGQLASMMGNYALLAKMTPQEANGYWPGWNY